MDDEKVTISMGAVPKVEDWTDFKRRLLTALPRDPITPLLPEMLAAFDLVEFVDSIEGRVNGVYCAEVGEAGQVVVTTLPFTNQDDLRDCISSVDEIMSEASRYQTPATFPKHVGSNRYSVEYWRMP